MVVIPVPEIASLLEGHFGLNDLGGVLIGLLESGTVDRVGEGGFDGSTSGVLDKGMVGGGPGGVMEGVIDDRLEDVLGFMEEDVMGAFGVEEVSGMGTGGSTGVGLIPGSGAIE